MVMTNTEPQRTQGPIELLNKIIHKSIFWLLCHGLTMGWVRCTKERFGTGYDAWDLSIEDLNHSSIVYSFGVGENISFDIEIQRRFGLAVYAFDPTPASIEWVRHQRLPESFIFHAYGIADRDGWAFFQPPDNPRHVSYSMLGHPLSRKAAVNLPVKRLGTIMRSLGHSRLDVLKLDIEGAEYGVIADMAKSAIRPLQLLIEFHHHFPGVGIGKTSLAIRTIAQMGYRAFSISDTGHEFCFRLTPRRIDTNRPRDA
jgi:FkbM family methyltransferase